MKGMKDDLVDGFTEKKMRTTNTPNVSAKTKEFQMKSFSPENSLGQHARNIWIMKIVGKQNIIRGSMKMKKCKTEGFLYRFEEKKNS